MKTAFAGQAVKCELVVLILDKWGLHPVQQESSGSPNLDDLEREASVLIPEDEYEKSQEILYGESEIERCEF